MLLLATALQTSRSATSTPSSGTPGSRKWFALIFIRDGKLCANLKCDPQKAGFWRSAYQAVTPAWHMNKTHWNTVELNAGIPREDLMEMVADSFNLTAPKTRGHK